jgi:3-phenylpropionate/cinnamic acid dioxygenase small subunit
VSDAAHVEAIRRLLYRYAECVDAADWEGVGALFAHADLCGPGMERPLRGAEAVRDLYAAANRVHEDGTPRTKHLVTNALIEVDAGAHAARARSVYVVLQATARVALQPIVAGRYHDRFERVGDAWRFVAREIAIDLVGDLGDHLRGPLPGRLAPR